MQNMFGFKLKLEHDAVETTCYAVCESCELEIQDTIVKWQNNLRINPVLDRLNIFQFTQKITDHSKLHSYARNM